MNVLQMCRVLSRAGYAVDLATYPIGENVDLPGLRIHRAPRIPGILSVPIGFSLRKLVLDASLVLLVAWLLVRRRYAVVHAIEEAVFIALPVTWLGIPLIYDLDSLISHQLEYSGILRARRLLRGVRALERLALARCRAVITVCCLLTDSARELYPQASLFQIEDTPLEEALREPHPETVTALRRQWKLESRQVVVYTGNLESYQGIELLLAAAPHLRERIPDAAIVLVGGEQADVALLRERLSTAGLGETLVIVGQRAPSEMPEWMALGQALVSPRTEGENTPLKIYTYMRSGTPIVATALATHTQVLNDSTAVLCDPTPDGLAAGMARVLRDPEGSRALGARAREIVEREYSFATFERKLLAVYRAVTQGAHCSPQGPRPTVG